MWFGLHVQRLHRCRGHTTTVILLIFLVALLLHLGLMDMQAPRLQDIGPVDIGTFFAALRQEGEGGQRRKVKKKSYAETTVVNVTWSEEIAENLRVEYKHRQSEVSEGCKILKKRGVFRPDVTITERHTLWDSKNNLIWCPVLKAGSTTWIRNFADLSNNHGPKLRKRLHGKSSSLRQPLVKKQKNQLLKKALKFFIVRHPFERILSAYRDKMLREKRATDMFRVLQIEVATKYKYPLKHNQSNATELQYSSRTVRNGTEWIHPTFTQFLLKVRDDMQHLWAKKGEFEINGHWEPYWTSCAPCIRKYDIIAKVETIDLDNEYIIQTAGLQDRINNTLTHSSLNDNFNKSSDAIQHYFSQVPLWLMKDLYELYNPDFTLFGYQPDYFFKLATVV